MKRKIPTQSYLLVLLFLIPACSILKSKQNKLFTVNDAFYQSWMISEKENGTTVYVVISDPDKDIIFDSIIFRGVQMPALAVKNEDITTLTSTLNNNQARLMDDKEVATNKPDQIIFRYKGEKRTYSLGTIRREEMKYKK